MNEDIDNLFVKKQIEDKYPRTYYISNKNYDSILKIEKLMGLSRSAIVDRAIELYVMKFTEFLKKQGGETKDDSTTNNDIQP